MKKIIFLSLFIFCFTSCKKKSGTDEPRNQQSYDKKVLLSNIADNIILPAYTDFNSSLSELLSAYQTFKISFTETDFQIVKQKLFIANLKYQHISPFEFGPAEATIVRMNFNVFPTDTVQIRANITTLSYDLNTANNLDAKGFPALDFLLYGINQTEALVIDEFRENIKLQKYVEDVIRNMNAKLYDVILAWNNSYRSTFINSLGTDVGSSLGFVVNQLNFELDYLKNAKIGTALGKKSLGQALPEKCEAFYSGNSLVYAIETLKAIETVYLGKSLTGADGEGFDNYLVHLQAKYNGGSLNDDIKSQFTIAQTKLSAISNPLSKEVIANPSTVDAAYTELLKLLVLLKTDLPSNLGVIITYQDGDGD